MKDGVKPGPSAAENAENRELKKRVRLLEQENEVLRRAAAHLSEGQSAGKTMYPLVRELAGDGIPVTVICRVLKIARQPYYRWLASPVTDTERGQAYRANALFDARLEDPEFGYRFLVDEAAEAGQRMAPRTAWRLCSNSGWWSVFGKKRGKKGRKPGPPVHEDRRAVTDEKGRTRHEFTADAPNELWVGDIPRKREVPPPNTGPAKERSTSARSRTCTPTGSWATPSTPA